METGSVLQQAVTRHMITNDGMWNRSENHWCLVYRNIFVSAFVNCSAIRKVIHTCLRLHAFRIQKPCVVLTHLNPVCWRTLSVFIKFLCQSCIDSLLDGVLWYYARKLHSIWSCVPVWMKHATHSLLLGVNIFSFALMKIINKLTNK